MNFKDKLQKAFEAGYHQALNEEYIEESIDKVKDLFDNQNIASTVKAGDRLEISTEQINFRGKQVTKKETFTVEDVTKLDSITRIELDSAIAAYTLYITQRGMVAFTLGDNRLVISGIRKK